MAKNIEVLVETVVPGKRLGRHIDHNARAWAKPFAGPLKAVQSVSWPRPGSGILDQGNVGSCTGNATVGALSTDPIYPALPANHPVLNEAEALKIYSAAEVIDGDGPYPPQDNGSTGPSAAKAAQNAGLIKGYNHYLDINSTLQALQLGPVIIGLSWYTSFDTPSSAGLISIAKGATVRGGHEVVVRSYDASTNLLGFDNSWGVGEWTADGSGFMSVATFTTLLAQGGDTTAFVPLSAPVPPVASSVKVPGLNGHSAGTAHNLLVAAGLVPVATAGQLPTDVVFGTSPKAGTEVSEGTKVTILASHR